MKNKTWNILMESGGGTVREFWGGFETEEEAVRCAEHYGWEYIDDNHFAWSLYIDEVECND